MVIRAHDRLADVLARDQRMLDIIAAAAPQLRGLKNPVTRRVMGRLATMGQVARMAGMEPDLLLRRLNQAIESAADHSTAGESATPATAAAMTPSPTSQAMTTSIDSPPAMLAALPPEQVVDLDVREDLRNGREPFSRIMSARASLRSGGVLRLRATFEPAPLYAVMSRQGFDHWTERLGEDDWRVWFYRPSSPDAAGASARSEDAPHAAAAMEPQLSPSGQVEILDVRGLEPPEPMVRTLAALERLPEGRTLLQINERVPQFLLPRLDELGFEHDIREQAEGVVRVFIRRAPRG